MRFNRVQGFVIILCLSLLSLACGPAFLARGGPTPTATPTKTPKPPPTATHDPALATATLPAAVDTPTPIPPTATPEPPTALPPTETPTATSTVVEAPPTDTPEPELPTATLVPAEPTATPVPPTETPTPEPAVAYKIVHFKVLGDGENNGGIFNAGGQHLIFLTVLDQNGNGLDGVVVKDSSGNNMEWVTGSKGPGKAEITMEYQPFKLYVAADPNGPTTSETSHQMSTLYPDLADVVGKLGPLENENSVCPTPDVRCSPPFYNVHFSYEITFQRVQ